LSYGQSCYCLAGVGIYESGASLQRESHIHHQQCHDIQHSTKSFQQW